jgi:hypothetical protein
LQSRPYNGASTRFDWSVFLDRCDLRPARRLTDSRLSGTSA